MVDASTAHTFAITLTTAQTTATKEAVRIHQVAYSFIICLLNFNSYMQLQIFVSER